MWHIQAHSLKTIEACPDCQHVSSSFHSGYTRRPQDLPCTQRGVRLELRVHRFRCHNQVCLRRTFVERLPELVPFYARRTQPLTARLRAVGFEAGAEGGARIGRHFGIQTSGDTLLRVLRQTPESHYPPPRAVGIDDWAFKKGLRYGTILVDLQRHYPIDLLPDRQPETVTVWLKQHPGIEILARDRSPDYARAATAGAPQAIQVADRWHLLKNLNDALQQVLEKYATRLRQWAVNGETPALIQATDVPKRPATWPEQQQSTLRRVVRLERYQQVHQLHQQGWQQIAIARHLSLSTKTVRRFWATDVFPERRSRHFTSRLDPYKPQLLQRWNQGCHNAARLAREIRLQGYPGGDTQVRDYVARLRQAQTAQPHPSAALLPTALVSTPLTPRRAAYLLLRPADEADTAHRAFLNQFFALFPELQASVEQFQAFAVMVRERQSAAFDDWLQHALHSDCASLKKFARGIQQDEMAVRAALSMTWSNGQSEGQINRLKFIKRQMYGRAKFDLLRLRVLHPP